MASLHPDTVVHIQSRTRPFLFHDTGFDAALFTGTAEQVARWPGTQAELLMREDVVPVCGPALLQGGPLVPAQVARLPLLQQSTRPTGWRQWCEAMAVPAPAALVGPRHELFSMLAVAAAHGLGVALMPPMLIEAELARGELVVACPQPLRGERSHYLVTPVLADEPAALVQFRAWMRQMAAQAAG